MSLQRYLNIYTFTGCLFLSQVFCSIEKSELVSLDTKVLYAESDSSINILAKASEGKLIQFCRWDSVNNSRIGVNGIVFVNDVDEIPSFSVMALQSPNGKGRKVPGYEFYGSGLSNGECGITIQNVTIEDITTWKFLLIEFSKAEGNPTAVTRDLELKQALPPTSPEILSKEILTNIIESNGSKELLDITCCSKYGVPEPTLKFQFDNSDIQSLDNQQITTSNDPTESKICIHWTGASFTRVDNGKSLKCILDHITRIGSEGLEGITEDSVNFDISYKPTLISGLTYTENNTIQIHMPAEDNRFYIRFSANPEPTVFWYRQNSNTGNFIEITGYDTDFSLSKGILESYEWEYSLKFNTKPNSTSTFKLVSSNKAGTLETYIVTIPRDSGEPIPEYRNNKGRSWQKIVLPLIGVLIILIIILIIIVTARRKGWLCWKNHIGKYNTKTRTNPDGKDDRGGIVYDPVLSTPEA